MRMARFRGSFVLVLLLNLLLNLQWSIPAWVLLVMHIWLGWSIGWFWLALAVWVLLAVLLTLLLYWSNRCGRSFKDTKPNINPYSASDSDMLPSKTER